MGTNEALEQKSSDENMEIGGFEEIIESDIGDFNVVYQGAEYDVISNNQNYNARNYKAIFANRLMQWTRTELKTLEMKCLYYIVSKMKPIKEGEEFVSEYKFNIADFCEVFQISNSGENYKLIKAALKKLSDSSTWVYTKDEKKEKLFRWLTNVLWDNGEGTATVWVNEALMEYFNQSEFFTQFFIKDTIMLHSKHAIILYPYFQSYENMGKLEVTPKVLRWKCNVKDMKSYQKWAQFNKVLEVAVREINQGTDLNISYNVLRQGNGGKVIKVLFDIEKKTQEEYAAIEEKIKEIDKKLMESYTKKRRNAKKIQKKIELLEENDTSEKAKDYSVKVLEVRVDEAKAQNYIKRVKPGKYTKQIHEYIKKLPFNEDVVINIDEFNDKTHIEKNDKELVFTRYAKVVLISALKEINMLSDYNVCCSAIKRKSVIETEVEVNPFSEDTKKVKQTITRYEELIFHKTMKTDKEKIVRKVLIKLATPTEETTQATARDVSIYD